MKSVSVKFAAAALLMLGVAACVPATTPTVEAPPVTVDGTTYAARSDSNFTVPALPVEQIPEQFRRQLVDYPTGEAPGTVIIDPAHRLLYYVSGKNQAIRYGIAVGAEGFGWSGVSDVANKRHWPTWTPPKEMIARKPELAKWADGQPGGPTNPLGARAIYLETSGVDYGYRIHGTPDWRSIGRNASSGCFRMINQDVMDLYERVQPGAKVVVLNRDGSYPTRLTIPPQPKKPAATPKPAAVVTPVVIVPTPLTTMPAATIPGLTPPAAVPAAAVEPAVEPAADSAPAAAAPAVPATPAPAEPCAAPTADGSCPAP
ncbi:MAG: L,D-transpeptidase [Paracoccaceae bacterium]